jgi:hypothetical protein
MAQEFNTRDEIIKALVAEFGEKVASFNANKSREKFWTFNRLFQYYWDLKLGRKETYRTELNTQTGYYELKK